MWRDDLAANAGLHTLLGAVRAWIFCPGFSAVTRARASIALAKYDNIFAKIASRFICVSIAKKFGCYIANSAKIGRGLFFPHPVGIVIGDGVSIGNNVTIYQNVTLGLKENSLREFPILEDNVTIYASAVVIGGVRIGSGSIVGAHSLVLKDVPPNSVASGIPATIKRTVEANSRPAAAQMRF